MKSEERHHVVLVDTITGNADPTNHRSVTVDRNAAGEYLKAIGDTGDLGPTVGRERRASGAGVIVGATNVGKQYVCRNIVEHHIKLEARIERTPRRDGVAERAVRRTNDTVGQIGS